MALDPSIPLSVRPPAIQMPNPLETLQAIAQIQGIREQAEARRLAGDAARQKAADEAAVRRVLTETGGDMEQALPRLRQIVPKLALEFETEIATRKDKAASALTHELEVRDKQFQFGLGVLNTMDEPAGYQAGLPIITALSPELAKLLPPTYDAAALARVTQAGLTAKELHDQRKEGLDRFLKGDAIGGLSRMFSTAQSQAHWDNIIQGAQAVGAPAALLEQFGPTWSPEAVARAQQLGITPEKREELAGQKETRAQTAAAHAATEAHQAEQERIARGQLAVSQGHLAVSQAAEKRQGAETKGGVKLTAGQQDDLATMLTVQQLAADATTLGTKTGWAGVGPWQGRVGATMLGSGGTEGETLRNKIGNIKGTIAKLRGGTSFTPNEQALLESYTPTETDPDWKIQAKLASMVDFIEKKRANTLRVARGEYTLPGASGAGGGGADAGRVRVVGPNGQTGTVPAGTTLPPGWRKQ